MPQDFDRGFFSGKLKAFQEIINKCEQFAKYDQVEKRKRVEELKKEDSLTTIKRQIALSRVI